MKKMLSIASMYFCLTAINGHSFAQTEPSQRLKELSIVMQEIQIRAQKEARINPDVFRLKAAAITDQHHATIIRSASSQDVRERRMAAMLLGMATPSDQGTTALVILASDGVPDVRYAALVAIAAATDGTNESANDVVLKALKELENPGIIRDAAFAASSLQLTDALPIFKQLLSDSTPLNKLYAADALARYGAKAAILLPELRYQITQVNEPGLKAALEGAEDAITKTTATTPRPPANRPSSEQPGSSVELTPTANKPRQSAWKAKTEQSERQMSSSLLPTIIFIIIVALIVMVLFWVKSRESNP